MTAIDSAPAPPRRAWWLEAAFGLLALAVVLLLLRELGGPVLQFADWVQGLGVWGPAAFVTGYTLATVALLPAWPLTLAGGAIFGLGRGVAYVFAGATLGASLAFLVSRHLARSAVERRLAGDPRFAAVDRAVGREGRKIVFLLRLSPLFPFNLLNYALGLTRVHFVDYLVASVGMLPGTLLYVYSGTLAGDVATIAAGAPDELGARQWAIRIVGLAATLAVTAVVTRTARRALSSEVADAGT